MGSRVLLAAGRAKDLHGERLGNVCLLQKLTTTANDQRRVQSSIKFSSVAVQDVSIFLVQAARRYQQDSELLRTSLLLAWMTNSDGNE
jgi:hypothetical protein